jgi:hypothetical protein
LTINRNSNNGRTGTTVRLSVLATDVRVGDRVVSSRFLVRSIEITPADRWRRFWSVAETKQRPIADVRRDAANGGLATSDVVIWRRSSDYVAIDRPVAPTETVARRPRRPRPAPVASAAVVALPPSSLDDAPTETVDS